MHKNKLGGNAKHVTHHTQHGAGHEKHSPAERAISTIKGEFLASITPEYKASCDITLLSEESPYRLALEATGITEDNQTPSVHASALALFKAILAHGTYKNGQYSIWGKDEPEAISTAKLPSIKRLATMRPCRFTTRCSNNSKRP